MAATAGCTFGIVISAFAVSLLPQQTLAPEREHRLQSLQKV